VLHARTVTALLAAREQGLRIVVATGRMFQSARPFALEAGADGPLVCYQGGYVADARSGRILSHQPIPLALARETIAAIEREGFAANCYVDDELYVAALTKEARFYAGYQGTPIEVHPVGDLLSWIQRPPTKLVVVALDGDFGPLESRLRAQLGDRLTIVRSMDLFLEVTDAGVTKRAGLDVAARELGVSPQRAIGFGDGKNDVELLGWAGYGVAVANADPDLLAIADLVCPSCDEDGVAQVVEALLDSRS
jgi:Cof subfamily protein (haloacid dehalogenase superfamily)